MTLLFGCCDKNGKGGVGGGWCPFFPIFPQRLERPWRPQRWERAELGSVPASEAPDPGLPHILGAPHGWRKVRGSWKLGPRRSERHLLPQALRLRPSSVPHSETSSAGAGCHLPVPLTVTGTLLLPALPLPPPPLPALKCFQVFLLPSGHFSILNYLLSPKRLPKNYRPQPG